jgi:hypothetical protein
VARVEGIRQPEVDAVALALRLQRQEGQQLRVFKRLAARNPLQDGIESA